MPEDRQEDTEEISSIITYSDDPDATWIKKGKKPYYGYKAHIAVDTQDGFILGGLLLPLMSPIRQVKNSLGKRTLPRILSYLPTKATAA